MLNYELAMASLEDAMRHRGGAVNLVVPVQIGQGTFIEDIDTVKDVLENSLNAIKHQVRGHAA